MKLLSTADIARDLGVERWRISRLFEDGTLPEPDRIAGRRAVPNSMLPQIVGALRTRGWLAEEALAS